jgi:hypothetical protein
VKKGPIYARLNTHITFEQQKFLKELSKKRKVGQGELFREIIKFFMDNQKTV